MKTPLNENPASPTPASLISAAQRSLPVFRWFTGAAGVLALAAAIKSWGVHLETLMMITAVLVVVAFTLLNLQRIAGLTKKAASGPAVFIAWSTSILLIAGLTLILTATITDWPWPLKSRISARISSRLLGSVQPIDKWIEVADAARKARSIAQGAALPTGVATARADFEHWWTETPLSARKTLAAQKVFQALSLNIRIYRDQEIESRNKPSSFKWAEEAVAFFRETNSTYFIAEALMEKAAVYIDLSDIVHVNAENFHRIAAAGDAVAKEAVSLATGEQQSEAYRMWSRFYYNLARPKSGNLSDRWDNNYLLVAFDRINEACQRDPNNIRNLSQLARTTQKAAANPPQDTDTQWTEKMWAAQSKLAARWKEIQPSIKVPREQISPLNTLAVLTLEAASRDFLETPEEKKREKAARLLEELDQVAIPAQRHALSLVLGTELEDQYDYDLYYDITRMFAVRVMLRAGLPGTNTDPDFSEVLTNLRKARDGATQQQRDAALAAIDQEECFKRLSPPRRAAIREIWR